MSSLDTFYRLVYVCFNGMVDEINRIGIKHGVAVIYVPGKSYIEYVVPHGKIWRLADPERGKDDTNVNDLAVAMGKIMQSVRTFKPSCSENAIKGESPWKGCFISDNNEAFFAFSGGREYENTSVALVGKKIYDDGI